MKLNVGVVSVCDRNGHCLAKMIAATQKDDNQQELTSKISLLTQTAVEQYPDRFYFVNRTVHSVPDDFIPDLIEDIAEGVPTDVFE